MQDIVVTKIDRIIYVSANEYKEKVTHFSPHFLSHELIYKFSGKTEIQLGKRTFIEGEGDVHFIRKGDYSKYKVDRLEYGDCVDIFFQTEQEIDEEFFTRNFKDNQKLKNLFNNIFIVWKTKKTGYQLQCMQMLYQILYEVTAANNYLPDKRFSVISPAIEEIDRSFNRQELCCEELASLCGVSYSYFKKLFLQKFGLSPKQYIYKRKMNYAQELLLSGKFNASQVAEQSGFSNVYFFSKQFKKHTGVTPTEFIRNYKSSK